MRTIRICKYCGHKQAIEWVGFGFFEESKVKWWTVCEECQREGAFTVRYKWKDRVKDLVKGKHGNN